MGIFGDLDAKEISDDPFNPADGTYHGVISKCETKVSKKGNLGLYITYKVTEGPEEGKEVLEFKLIPEPKGQPTKEELQQASWLKQRLLSLGVDEDDLNTVENEDLLNREVVFTVEKRGEYTNVTKVMVPVMRSDTDEDPFGDFK